MKKKIKPIACGIMFFVLFMALFWYGGIDFSERSERAATGLIASTLWGFVVWFMVKMICQIEDKK